ncbi:hypothetical protein [Oceaniradius stylonematis]|uniref:hypothetical protein n=1 Tax=Oceaniradius stylonematis TaxID=2184161 RepID=UPI00273E9381|nr:hypothetical protein [Oceaniradius stylonematis]
MSAPSEHPPLVTTELADFRAWFEAHFRPDQPAEAEAVNGALRQIDLLTTLASAVDKEVAIHRQIMDGAHARRLALRLGNPSGPETIQ